MARTFQRITNAQAKKRFKADQPIYLCHCKCHPYTPWNLACLILGKEYIEQAEMFTQLDKQDATEEEITERAWRSMIKNWLYYNASNETGYYPHYYIQH